jgi:hypothetical protein
MEALWDSLPPVPFAYKPSGRASFGAQLGVLLIAVGVGLLAGLFLFWLYFGSWEWLRDFLGNPAADEPYGSGARRGRSFGAELILFVTVLLLLGVGIGFAVQMAAVWFKHQARGKLRVTGFLGGAVALGVYLFLAWRVVDGELLDSVADWIRLGIGGSLLLLMATVLAQNEEPLCEVCNEYMHQESRWYSWENVPELLTMLREEAYERLGAITPLSEEPKQTPLVYARLDVWYCPRCRTSGVVALKLFRRRQKEGGKRKQEWDDKRVASALLSAAAVEVIRRHLEEGTPSA